MALPGGVQITGFLSPTASGDTYATHDALYGRDGLRNVDLLSDLDNISADRRRAGMIVGVGGFSGFASHYTLLPEGTGWTYTIADWGLAFLPASATTALVASAISNDVYTTGSTLVGSTLYFDTTAAASAYTADLSSLVVNDTFISGMTFNVGNYDLTIHRNDGTNFTESLSILATDMVVTGGTYEISTGVVTFTNNSGGTFNVSGFTSGMTDSFTTTAYTVGDVIQFDNNIQGSNLYNVDLSSVLTWSNVLSNGQTSGGNDAILTSGDLLKSSSGGGALDLRVFGTNNNVLLSSDSTAGFGFNDASLYLTPTQGGVFFSDTAATEYNSLVVTDEYATVWGNRNGRNNAVTAWVKTGATIFDNRIEIASTTGNITLTAGTGNIYILNPVATDNTLTSVLGRDSSDGKLRQINFSAITGNIGANFGNTYFVAPEGDDPTGVRGDILNPFQTISGARNKAVSEITGGTITGTTLIYVFPGTYTDEEMQYENGNFYFSPGARVEGVVRSNSGGTTTAMFVIGATPLHNPSYTANTCNVFGDGDFYLPESEDGDWNGSIFSITASGSGYFECHEFVVQQGVGIGVLDYGQATFRGAFLGVEESGYVATVRDYSDTVFDFQRIYNNTVGWPFLIRHGNESGFFGSCVINSGRIDAPSGWQAVSTLRMRPDSRLIMNCPIIQSVDNYVLNIQQGTGGVVDINGNLYGNKALISNSNTGGVLNINGNIETVSTAFEMNAGNNIDYRVNYNGDIKILSGTTQAIALNDGTLRLNGSIENQDISGSGTTYNGVSITGVGKLIVDTCKIITDNECITASSAKDIKVIHSLASNQNVNSNITNLITGSNIIIDSEVE